MREYKRNIIECLLLHAESDPALPAFTLLDNADAERICTFRQLAIQVQALAFRLKENSLAGRQVLLIYQDTLEFIIAFLACQYTGIIAVPVPYAKGSKQIARLMNIRDDAEAAAIFCTKDALPYLEKEFTGTNTMRIIPTDLPGAENGTPLMLDPEPGEIAFLQYTSGSTGNPKGVVITAENLLHNQQLIKNTFGCNRDSVIFSWLPFHHDMGLIGNILHTVYVGCRCILLSPFQFMQSPLNWLRAITQYKVTHSGGPNFAYDLCVDKIPASALPGLDLSSWKVAYNGSEPVRSATLERFAQHFQAAGFRQEAFHPCYGLAEATLLASGIKKSAYPETVVIEKETTPEGKIKLAAEINDQCQVMVGAGGVPEGMTVQIISPDHQRVCGELEEGEICIGGDSVTRGYWNKSNNDIFYASASPPFFRTGDLGFFYNGLLYIRGRLADMLIVRGRNVFPYDIEQLVAACDTAIENNGVAAFSISASPDELVIAAEIRRAAIQTLDAAAVIHTIGQTVSGSYGIHPKDILLLAPLGNPRTTSGKIQRVKCRKKYQEKTFRAIASLLTLAHRQHGSRDETLEAARVLRQVNQTTIKNYLVHLINNRVGNLPATMPDDTIELTRIGIDSLKATELINIINRELSINIEVAEVFRDNSLAGLISTIESLLWLKHSPPFGEEITI